MNLLTMEHLTKAYTERLLLDDTELSIHEGDKIGVIGVNGTGKSTLLRIVAGLEATDEGKVTKGRSVTIGYLAQQPDFKEDHTVLQAVIDGNANERNRWTLESDARQMIASLHIPDENQPIRELSGGQRKRAALARVLLGEYDILVLDEPTNHLDNGMAAWLEEFLLHFRGAVLMVTHDRYFLDRVSNRIIELDHGKIYNYPGNYSEFLRLKEARQNIEIASERKRQSLLRTELAWLARGARARSTKQKAHIERIEKMQQVAAPIEEQQMEMSSVVTRMGRKTIEAEHLSKRYGDRVLFEDYSYIFLRGERIGIIGENGCGKSTLLKILTGNELPDSGTVTIGETVSIGYFAQDAREMDEQMRAIDYVKEVGEYVTTTDGKITAAMLLERFLFDGSMQYSPIGKLSGGERRRLQLLRVLMSAPNVLILDEPTNDLDIRTLTILEDYLDSFEGIVIVVSHDRYFLDRIVRRIFAFEENGKIQQYEGGYSDYLNAYELRHPSQSEPGNTKADRTERRTQSAPEAENKNARSHEKKLKFTFKEQREFDTIEEDIEALETRISELEDEMQANAASYGRLTELNAEKEAAEEELMQKMERWEYLTELHEQIQAQQEKNDGDKNRI
ncbi:MAG: ABC-F family ATP-binding cassette domain-containing protein [Eubacteriales bacterium]|nr:ABC-F family ATP-binding cassette domain-containing protein [Eubacteriales bacterium]